ncbi:hypothetical protein H2204_001502 [Knufia peltigerae]|uniref:Xylanolytic transcriptional activator regulatory domain-containing protein n=1 Tax=Knufia peltigerae TaxID=1002370 RepID=A0AA38YDE8_9EURO|nr:hypothetical protein H2204_001502 [Knufia peltigerae]
MTPSHSSNVRFIDSPEVNQIADSYCPTLPPFDGTIEPLAAHSSAGNIAGGNELPQEDGPFSSFSGNLFAWQDEGVEPSYQDVIFPSIFEVSENVAADYNFDLFTEDLLRLHASESLPGTFASDLMSFNGTGMATSPLRLDYSYGNALQENQNMELEAANVAAERLKESTNATFVSRPQSPGVLTEQSQWMKSLVAQGRPSFDRDVINAFLALFEDNISAFFPGSGQTKFTRESPRHIYLAMAGVGGCFCSIEGSTQVAKWFYYNARRELFTDVYHSRRRTFDEKLCVIQTFCLLELFGYLCGDQRAYELTEVWHLEMLQIARQFGLWTSAKSDSEERQSGIIHILYTLECYRTIILQRPAMFYAPTAQPAPSSFPFSSSWWLGPKEESLETTLQSIASHGTSTKRIKSSSMSFLSLCAISLSASQSTCIGNLEPSQSSEQDISKKGDQGAPSQDHSTRKFFEMLLNNWRCSHAIAPEPSTMMLFHLVHLNIYVSLSSLQDVEQWNLRHRCFYSDEDKAKSLWHAGHVLRLAKDMSMLATPEARESGTLLPPHFPHAVFLASLCFWRVDYEETNDDSMPGAYNNGITRGKEIQLGESLISRHRSGMARVYKKVLERLRSVV